MARNERKSTAKKKKKIEQEGGRWGKRRGLIFLNNVTYYEAGNTKITNARYL